MTNVIHEVGGYVFLIMTDNLSVNQKMFKVYHKENLSDILFLIQLLVLSSRCMICLIVSKTLEITGLLSHLRQLEFVEPITQKVHQAKWKGLVQIYHDECNSIMKETKLSYAALYPTNFEKQKVQLACDIFNEKTVAALEKSNLVDTAIFVNGNKNVEYDQH